MNKLRAMALEKLMELDPNKKGLTNDQFMDKFISKGRKPSKQDVENFIKERKIPKEHLNDQLRERITKYLEVELKKGYVEEWLSQKTADSPIEIYLARPTRPVFDVPIGNAPFYGKADSKVTVVEFSDFQCPFCAKSVALVDQILAKYPNDVKVIIKNFPLSFHKQAYKAARYALAAHQQGKFKEMYRMIFENYKDLKENENLPLKYAKELNLNMSLFMRDFENQSIINQIESEKNELRSQFEKILLPTFLIQGKAI